MTYRELVKKLVVLVVTTCVSFFVVLCVYMIVVLIAEFFVEGTMRPSSYRMLDLTTTVVEDKQWAFRLAIDAVNAFALFYAGVRLAAAVLDSFDRNSK